MQIQQKRSKHLKTSKLNDMEGKTPYLHCFLEHRGSIQRVASLLPRCTGSPSGRGMGSCVLLGHTNRQLLIDGILVSVTMLPKNCSMLGIQGQHIFILL